MNNLKAEPPASANAKLLNEFTYQINMRKDIYQYNNFLSLYSQYACLSNPQVVTAMQNCQIENAKTSIKNSFHINQLLPELFDEKVGLIYNFEKSYHLLLN